MSPRDPTLAVLDDALATLNTINGISSRQGFEVALSVVLTDMLAAMGRQPVVLAQALNRPDQKRGRVDLDSRTRDDVLARVARAQEILTPGLPNAVTVLVADPNGATKLPAVMVSVTQFSVAQDLAVCSDFAHCEFVTQGGKTHEDLLLAQFYRGSIELSMWATGHADSTILEDVVRSAILRFDDSLRAIGIRELSGGEGSGYQVTDQLLGVGAAHIPVITYTFTAEVRATQRRPNVVRAYSMVMTNST